MAAAVASLAKVQGDALCDPPVVRQQPAQASAREYWGGVSFPVLTSRSIGLFISRNIFENNPSIQSLVSISK